MKILAIETSCDDTAVAILSAQGGPASGGEASFEILASIIASQIEVHQQFGGVYPFAAKREHIKNLPATFTKALKIAKLAEKDIDLIAVASGPGLEPCLWVGVNFAKDLAKKWNVSLVPVNHIESHILVNFLVNKEVKFPAVALVVSGGHTQLILMRGKGKYKILGETRDDAAGECFDKCAKILGLGYPGGPEIARLAEKAGGTSNIPPLPRPMINTKDHDFSFSGLKTAVLYAWQKCPKIDDRQKMDTLRMQFAVEIQQAIIDVLLKKTIKAVKDYRAKTLILGGGVSANSELRRQFLQTPGVCLIFPPADLSTDNAVMIAVAGWFHRKKKVASSRVATIRANANLRIGS